MAEHRCETPIDCGCGGAVPTTQVGWLDEHGNLWSLGLRNGAVQSDRPVFVAEAGEAR